MQVAFLAVADAVYRRIVLMVFMIIGITVGDVAVLGAGMWSWIIFGSFLYALRLVTRAEGNLDWEVVGQPPAEDLPDVEHPDVSSRRLTMMTIVVALAIYTAGWALSSASEALAAQTGLGQSFFGAVFVAITTSLLEISTVLAAMRLKRFVMAVSDIFGTNLFDITLILLVDLAYFGPPVLGEAGSFSIVAGALCILVTAIYMAGLLERRDPAVAGVGLGSIAIAVTYIGGVALLFGLR